MGIYLRIGSGTSKGKGDMNKATVYAEILSAIIDNQTSHHIRQSEVSMLREMIDRNEQSGYEAVIEILICVDRNDRHTTHHELKLWLDVALRLLKKKIEQPPVQVDNIPF